MSLAIGRAFAASPIMPASRLATMKNVTWIGLTSPQKAVAKIQPTLSPVKANLKLMVPGYEVAQLQQENISFHRFDVPGAGVTPRRRPA